MVCPAVRGDLATLNQQVCQGQKTNIKIMADLKPIPPLKQEKIYKDLAQSPRTSVVGCSATP